MFTVMVTAPRKVPGVPLTDWPGCGVLGVVTVWDPAALVEWVGDQLALRR